MAQKRGSQQPTDLPSKKRKLSSEGPADATEPPLETGMRTRSKTAAENPNAKSKTSAKSTKTTATHIPPALPLTDPTGAPYPVEAIERRRALITDPTNDYLLSVPRVRDPRKKTAAAAAQDTQYGVYRDRRGRLLHGYRVKPVHPNPNCPPWRGVVKAFVRDRKSGDGKKDGSTSVVDSEPTVATSTRSKSMGRRGAATQVLSAPVVGSGEVVSRKRARRDDAAVEEEEGNGSRGRKRKCVAFREPPVVSEKQQSHEQKEVQKKGKSGKVAASSSAGEKESRASGDSEWPAVPGPITLLDSVPSRQEKKKGQKQQQKQNENLQKGKLQKVAKTRKEKKVVPAQPTEEPLRFSKRLREKNEQTQSGTRSS
ncbi:hypothetical protein H072_10117 [Dactylellina haptotyla CBS 200.50]|uniref:Uncharacterized protein n=1 Tax=Dactylellina haptotyla (strain CBS 200.50) TaxID=1284197 RepID=S8BB74_DACHA|nr:hypothetical protein H072_10117 [Dactylellina haptotyla CBS 200.50]